MADLLVLRPPLPLVLAPTVTGVSSGTMLDIIMSNVWKLVMRSSVHREWAVKEIERLFLPAVQLGQIFVWLDPLARCDLEPVGLATWVELPLSMIEEVVRDTRKLQPEHWQRAYWDKTYQTMHVFIADMIAPYGHCTRLVAHMRGYFHGKTCFALRRNHGRRRLAVYRGYPDHVPVHALA